MCGTQVGHMMHKYIVKGKTGLFVSLSFEQKDTPITVLEKN